MKHFVVGFPILPDRTGLALILKNRPDWQRGKYNGIGGKVEWGETTAQAMDREATEEAGLAGLPWENVCTITGTGFRLWYYAAFDERAHGAKTLTDERVEFFPLRTVWTLPVVSTNLFVALTIALDRSGIKIPVQLTDTWPITR